MDEAEQRREEPPVGPPIDPPAAAGASRANEPFATRVAPPTSPLDVHVPPPASVPTNWLGVAAFVLALSGFCLPIVPSLLGLVAGIVAVRREPRGFAIAGIVLSVLSGCIGSTLVFLTGLPLLVLISIMGPILPPPMMDNAVGQSLSSEVDTFRRERGRLPNDLGELPSGPGILAEHPNPLRIEFGTFVRFDPTDPVSPGPVEVDYRIVSAGDDGTFGTSDDVVVLGLPSGDDRGASDGTPPEDLESSR